jgi:6,7-dimethyl-8-ribityllumazine synthase
MYESEGILDAAAKGLTAPAVMARGYCAKSFCAPRDMAFGGAMRQHRNPLQSISRSQDPAHFERIAFVQSCWHRDIVDQARIGFLRGIKTKGLEPEQIESLEVPGAFEIPLHAKLLAQSGRYAAIVAAGFVVDGGIYRHEFVASSVIDALMRVQLETEVPIISVVLTPQHFHEHEEHREFFHRHFIVKGEEAAAACAAVIAGISRLRLQNELPRRPSEDRAINGK